MKKVNSSCPVPIEQQPIYEYNNLKKSLFFFWTTEDLKSYFTKILTITISNYIFIEALLTGSNSNELNKFNHLNITSLLVDSILIVLFIRIYLGWEYIYNRLKKATVTYEESGWYDGQVWIKTPEILVKDRLLADYVLLPIIKRVKITLMILVIFFGLCLYNAVG